MDTATKSSERSLTMQSSPFSISEGSVRVFQPPKLTETVELINMLGNIQERLGEDRSQDMGGGGMAASGQGSQGTAGTTTRDDLLKNLPVPVVMQQKLVSHMKGELKSLEREARKLSSLKGRGSAYALSEIYKRIRRLSTLIEEIVEASVELIRRFYVAIFIDRQTLWMSDGPLGQSAR